jgi:hypothetical protein
VPSDHAKGMKLKHGDIGKMATRVEMITNVIIQKGKRKRWRMEEIIREINSDKIIAFKEMPLGMKMWSEKFPEIPKQRDLWTGDVKQ